MRRLTSRLSVRDAFESALTQHATTFEIYYQNKNAFELNANHPLADMSELHSEQV